MQFSRMCGADSDRQRHAALIGHQSGYTLTVWLRCRIRRGCDVLASQESRCSPFKGWNALVAELGKGLSPSEFDASELEQVLFQGGRRSGSVLAHQKLRAPGEGVLVGKA